MYLTQAATCNQGANLELLLSGHRLTYSTRGTIYYEHQLSTGPYVPAAITCLSAVQALWLTKPHHTTTSVLSTNAIHLEHFV